MFSEQWLANKGLLSHFYIDPEGCKRLWHPIEVLLHHGVCTTQFVHGDWSLAWLHAGNQIATPHALLLLTNMLRMMHLPYTPDVPNVLQGFFESHITADSLCIVQCSKGQIISAEPVGWTESQFASIDNFHECLKDGNVPPGLSWSIDGLHPLQLQMPKAIPAASGTTGIEATCPFYATLTAAFTSSKAFFEFDYDQEVSCNTLLCVWDHAMTVHQDASQLVLQPNMTWTGQDETNPKVLIFAAANGIRILKPERESLNKAVPGVTVFFDQFGPISHMSFDKTVIVYEQNPCPTIPEWNQTAAKFVMAMNQCQTYVHIDPLAHDMHLTFQGPHACVATVVNFWQCVVGRDFMKHVGLSMQCTSNKAGATIKMVYDEGRCPLPFTGLKIQLVVFAARALFAKLENAHGKLVRIKWMARPLWQGRLPAATTGATILQILHAVTMIHTGSIKYRMICNGKRFVDERTLGDLNHDGQTPVTIHTVLQLHGGGPPGTKQSLKIQTKNAFASMLLEEGFELTWIGQALDTMMQKAPAKDVNEIFHMTAGPQKLQCLLEVLKQCDTQIPKIKPALSSQAAANAKRKKFPTLPQPDQYAVVPGSLLNEDGSEACQTLEFGCQVTGFYVATQQFAVPWLRTGEKIAADELAMLIMGDLPLETALPTNKVTLPFRDEKGRDVLIACNLIQFGEKSIIPKELDPHLIASDNTSLMAITLWQQDWEEQWSSICENPYKFVKNSTGNEDLVVSIWGRSFRKGKTPTTARDCTSIQMHCLLKTEKMHTFMSRSGFNMIWLTPKAENGRPHDMWKLIWLDRECDVQQASVIGARIHDAAGLVRSNQRFAIRVPASNFENDWNLVFPGVPVPISKDTSIIFKIQSLPFGTTMSMLEAWSKHIQWDFKPLRAVGPKAWIVGAGSLPETKQYAFNGMPVLIQEIHSRQANMVHPIVAGPKPGQRSEIKSVHKPQPIALTSDPWAAYTGPRPQAAVPFAGSGNNQHPGRIVGPTADRLTQQDEKIEKLQKTIQDLQQGQEAQGLAIHQAHEEAKKRDVAVRNHVDQQMHALKTELNNSFVNALRAQSHSFESSLNEIKNLILDRNKRKSPEEEEDALMNQP